MSLQPLAQHAVHKVSVSVPAVCAHLGPGLDVLGLALNLRSTVEMALRDDDQLVIRCAARAPTACRRTTTIRR